MPGSAPAPPERCWLLPSVEVRRSTIEGRGLFATEPVAAGSVVGRLGGRLVDGAELRMLLAAAELSASYVDTITVLPDLHLVLP